jgi:Ca2+-binding EF-hand superfamily protein
MRLSVLPWAGLLAATLTAPVASAHDCDGPASRAFGMGLFERLDADRDGRVTAREADSASLALFAELDADADGLVPVSEAVRGATAWRRQRFDARFRQLDRNGDARLDRLELELPERRFVALDRDGSGSLSSEELSAHLLGRRSARRESTLSAFRRADADADGRVTQAESLAEARRRFALRDDNGDGVLTRAVLKRSWRRRR